MHFSFGLSDRAVPTARAIPSGEAAQAIESDRQARLNIGSPSRQNLATKIMSNGVELIIAGRQQPSIYRAEFLPLTTTGMPNESTKCSNVPRDLLQAKRNRVSWLRT